MGTRLFVGHPQNSTVVNENQFISVGVAGGSTNQAGINFLVYNAQYGGRIYTDDNAVRGLAFDVLQVGTFYNAMNITRTTSPNVLIGTTTDSGYKLSVAGNVVLGYAQNRPVFYDSNGGSFQIKANAGGWATGYFFQGSSGTFRGGWGGFGGNDDLGYLWAGDAYDTPTMVVFGGQGSVEIGRTSVIASEKLGVQISNNAGIASVPAVARFMNNGSGYLTKLTLTDNNIADATISFSPVGSGGSMLSFGIQGTTVNYYTLNVRESGNVLIGTTTDNGRKLQVQGDASVSGEIYSNQISQNRYIRYVFGGTNFAVGAGTGIRWVIGRVYWNQVHWGSYSGMDIEIVNNYYNGARKKYTITNGAGGASIYLRSSQSYGSAYSRIVLGSAVDTGTTSGGYINYYQDVYLEVHEYNQVSVIGELKGPTISIDKTSIGGGEYGWATLFSSPSASNISTFNSTEATILTSENNWGYIDNRLGVNNSNPVVYSGYSVAHLGSANSIGLVKLGTGVTADGPEFFSNSNSDVVINTNSVNTGITIKGNTRNVLIGTTTDSGYKLRVNGSSYFDAPILCYTGNGFITALTNDGVGSNFGFGYSFLINNTGHEIGRIAGQYEDSASGGTGGVGIYTRQAGTLNQRLIVSGGGTVQVNNNAAASTASTNFIAYAYDSDSFFKLGNNTNNSLDIQLTRSDTATMFTVNGHTGNAYFAGNVGIGNTSPDAKLTIGVDDSATNVGYIRLRGHDVYEGNIYKTATYGIYMDTDTNARPIRIDGSAFITGITGNVLIGTTTNAGYRLDVNGTTRVQGDLITTGRQYVQSTPVNIKLPWSSLSINGTAVSDTQASDGLAGVRYSSSGSTTFFYGPYQAIDAGSYVARFRIKVASNASASYIGYIDVVGTNISGEAVSLRPNMLPTGGDYYYIDVPFNCNNDSSVFETRWIGWVGGITDTYIDHVLIVPQSRTNNVYVTDGDDYTIYESQLPRLTIKNATGNVGIGTTSPAAKLHIKNTVAEPTGIIIENTNNAQNLNIDFWNNVGAVQARINYAEGAGDFNFYPNTGAGEALTLKYGGNVGIGTTAPLGPLEVYRSNTGGLGGHIIVNNNGTAVGNETAVIFGDGGSNGFRAAISSTTENSPYYGDLKFKTGANVYSSLTTKMIITGAGNVGIGTTNPAQLLQVQNSTDNAERGIRIINSHANTSADASLRIDGYAGSYIDFYRNANARWRFNRIAFSDDFKITAEAANGGAGDVMYFDYDTGNVGIGTTTPSYKLDVVGDARITSGSLGVGVAPNATDGRIDASNDIVAYQTSDQRLKENVTQIENALEKVKSLTGVEFDWIEEHKHIHGYEGHDTGIIAQQVQAVMPTAVRTNDSGYLSVRYEKMIALLIEGMKEQQNQIDELKAKLNDLTC
jgi:hypothetical protein